MSIRRRAWLAYCSCVWVHRDMTSNILSMEFCMVSTVVAREGPRVILISIQRIATGHVQICVFDSLRKSHLLRNICS